MKPVKTIAQLTILLIASSTLARSQASPTASKSLQLSAFAAGSGVFTDLLGGHNLSLTAGGDLAFRTIHGFHPAIELRGTYPVKNGTISSQVSVLGGVRVDRQYGRLNPYIDFLAGRGQINYQNGGYTVGFLKYISTTTNVYSPGAGIDLDLSRRWALKADYQYQYWKTPVVVSGTIHPSVVSIGVVYKFNFDRTYKRQRSSASTSSTSGR